MNKKLIISILLVIIWMGLIFFMSNLNRDESNNASCDFVIYIIEKFDKITHASSETIAKHHRFEYINYVNHLFRKMCHFLEYLALAILVFNLVIHLLKNKLIVYNLITILLCFLYACSDEYHQTFVLGRGGMFSDVLIDTVGALMGCFLINMVYLITKRYQRRKVFSSSYYVKM